MRKRTRNARSDLRPVLVETFPELMLNPSQKICSMCRRKLYVMQNRTLTANAEDRTDVELPDESHGEDVAEENVDLMAQSENSPCVTDLNEAALYEVTDAISEESTDCSASSKVEDEFIQMNVGLVSFGVSPLFKRQMQRKGIKFIWSEEETQKSCRSTL